jgi:hypothetical protein
MKIVFSVLLLLFIYSCDSVDSSIDNFSIRTERLAYKVNNTTSILTTFKNNIGTEVKIYNSSCGGPNFLIEKYDEGNWILFIQLPICDRIPDEPIKLNDGDEITININLSLIQNIDVGLFRMKFEIRADNKIIDDKFLHSNQFTFVQ